MGHEKTSRGANSFGKFITSERQLWNRSEISINNARLEKKSKIAGNSTKKTNENLKMGSSFFLESASTAMGKYTVITWASRHKNAVTANDSDALYAIQGKILKLFA